jgi:hypothetical protein
MIKGVLHERGHRDGAAFMDQIDNLQTVLEAPASAYSFLTVTNTSPSPRHTRIRAMRPAATF